METTETHKSREALESYCARYESQNQAARSLNGVSAATITQIMQGNYDTISDKMWRNIASQIGTGNAEWVFVETEPYKMLTELLKNAQEYSNVFAACGEAGTGKSYTLWRYVKEHKRVYLLRCSKLWDQKIFTQELFRSLGRDSCGRSVGRMIGEAVRFIKTQEHPLILLDEADKLQDKVMQIFITLYNELEEHCGIVLCATDHLKQRIKRGVELNKEGYKEIYSRIGRKFIELDSVTSTDIASICLTNGIGNRQSIKTVIEESKWDLRRVKRKIHALKQSLKTLEEPSELY